MKLGIIVNEKSGSVPNDGEAALASAIQEAGHEPLTADAPDDDLSAKTEALKASGAEAVVVWGGDGTIASILQYAEGSLPVLVLPGGTMNLLPKRLHDDETDWQKVLKSVLENPKPKWISAGEVDGQRFYVAALFGQMTKFGASREAMREGDLLEAVNILTTSDALDIDDNLELHVDLPAGKEALSATALAVMPEDGSGFEVATVAPDNHFDLAASALGALFRGWREGAHFHATSASSVNIRKEAGGIISSTIDGEPTELDGTADVKYIAKAACVLVAGEKA